MSYKVTAWVREHSQATLGTRLVLFELADRANDDGTGCWPSIDTIAKGAKLSRRAVQSALRKLENELHEIKPTGVHPEYRTTIYAVVMPTADEPGADTAGGADNDRVGGADSAHKPVQQQPLDSATAESVVDIEREVFEHWVTVMEKTGSAKFTAERRRKVRARLKDGYTIEDLKLAIDGCRNTPHNMGDNDRKTLFNDLELICRTGANVERFRDHAGRKLPSSGRRSVETNIDDSKAFAKGAAFLNGEQI